MAQSKASRAKAAKVKPAKSASKGQIKATKKAAKKSPTKAKSKPASKAKAAAPKKAAASRSKAKVVAKTKVTLKASVSKTAKASAVSAAAKRPTMAQLESVLSPLDNRVVVEAVVPATRTAGGLYLPDTVSDSDRHRSGRVIAVGRGKLNKKGVVRPLDVKTGDTVLFTAHSGSEVELEGVQLVILREDEILGVSTAD